MDSVTGRRLIILITLLFTAAGFAGTIHVPAQQPTLAAAVAAAGPGDEIIVADGTYGGPGFLNVSTAGKAVIIRSQNGAQSCTIDLAGAGRAFSIISGETAATIIEGFTITHGNANLGGAILCTGSSPTIRECIFIANLSPGTGGSGGAIRCSNAKPLITECHFEDNSAFAWGGAIFLDVGSSAIIQQCTFLSNGPSKGGAIYSQNGSHPKITDCSFEANEGVIGAAIYNWNVNSTIDRCTFRFNVSSFNGGAIANTGSGSPTIANCLIEGNSAVNGGGVLSSDTTTSIINCTIVENVAAARTGGGVLHLGRGVTTIRNSILWGNSPDQAAPADGAVILEDSTVQGGWPDDDVSAADPLFINPKAGDWRLAPASPAVNTGNPTALPSWATLDLDGNPRIVGSSVDQGAFELQIVPGDLNGDAVVDGADLGLLLAAWDTPDAAADLNADGVVDGADLGLLLSFWS